MEVASLLIRRWLAGFFTRVRKTENQERDVTKGGKEKACSACWGGAYLCRVHLKLAHDLDRNLIVLSLIVPRPVDVAESAIAHLFDQGVPVQTGVSWELAFALALFGNDTLKHGVVFLLLALALLLVVDGTGSGMAGSGSIVPVVYRLGGELMLLRGISLERLVPRHIRLTGGGVGIAVSLIAAMLLCVDVGYMGGSLVLRRRADITSLLAVPYEVLEVLYGRHVRCGSCTRSCVCVRPLRTAAGVWSMSRLKYVRAQAQGVMERGGGQMEG